MKTTARIIRTMGLCLESAEWNLLLACQHCNRGESGKFAKLPELRMLD